MTQSLTTQSITKSIVAIATAILAATTMLASTAEAGMRVHLGFGGLPPYLTDYNKEAAYETRRRAQKRAYRAARRHQQAPVRAAKKATSIAKAKAEPEVEVEVEKAPAKAAQMENSSISVASLSKTTADAEPVDEPVKTAAIPSEPEARHIDCKKYFPAVGMTLTVPCQ
jgi:hypothetical protein